MKTKADTHQWRMTVEWTEGGKYGAGWSQSFDGDITIPDGVTTETIRDYLHKELTKDEEPGSRIVQFQLNGEVLVDGSGSS